MIVSVLRKPVRERERTKDKTPVKLLTVRENRNREKPYHTGNEKISSGLETQPTDDEGGERSEIRNPVRCRSG